MVTQQDSRVILTHSEVMKGIAAVTMFFLPATTIAVSFPLPSLHFLPFFFVPFPFLLLLLINHQLLKKILKTDSLWLPILLQQPTKQQVGGLARFLDVLVLGYSHECRRFSHLFDLAVCLACADE